MPTTCPRIFRPSYGPVQNKMNDKKFAARKILEFNSLHSHFTLQFLTSNCSLKSYLIGTDTLLKVTVGI